MQRKIGSSQKEKQFSLPSPPLLPSPLLHSTPLHFLFCSIPFQSIFPILSYPTYSTRIVAAALTFFFNLSVAASASHIITVAPSRPTTVQFIQKHFDFKSNLLKV